MKPEVNCIDVCSSDSCRLSSDIRESHGDSLPDVDPETCRLTQRATNKVGGIAVIRAVEDGRPANGQSPAVSIESSPEDGDRTITYHTQSP